MQTIIHAVDVITNALLVVGAFALLLFIVRIGDVEAPLEWLVGIAGLCGAVAALGHAIARGLSEREARRRRA